MRRTIPSTRWIAGLVLLSGAWGCSDESGMGPGGPGDTVVRGFVVVSATKGFDFSAERILRPDLPDSAAFVAAVDSMDILLGGQRDPAMPGQPLRPILFHLMGSPTPFVVTQGDTTLRLIGEDPTRPSVLRLGRPSLDDVSVVPEDGYATSYHEDGASFAGSVFAVRTKDGKYAIVQVAIIDTVTSETVRITLQWKYQMNGTARF